MPGIQATETVFGKQISVIDTPGILSCQEEIKTRCQSILQCSRPCLFLVVLSVGRFTDEQEKALKATTSVLGDDESEKSFMLFTNGDALKKMSLDDFIFEDEEVHFQTLLEYLQGSIICSIMKMEDRNKSESC